MRNPRTGMRVMLGGQGIRVVGVYPGPVDTDMAEKVLMEKVSPASVATAILDGLEAGEEDRGTSRATTGDSLCRWHRRPNCQN
jgi:NAD(P)-dependent dehydrogenase (short-subunit alcohol dehydrogenase family)